MKPIQVISLLSALVLAACSPKEETGGYVQTAEIKDKIAVGQSTRDDVLTKLGSPSSRSSFGQETWYYITNRKEAIAFLRPEVVEQDVVRIDFDGSGVVSNLVAYNKENGKDFALTKRTTPTEGHTLGFVEQLLGNLGRFNRPGGQESAAPGRRPGGGF